MSVSRKKIQLTTSDPLKNDFGILGLSLIHDLAGPVTAALMDVERLNDNIQKLGVSIRQAQQNIVSTNRKSRFNLARLISSCIKEITKVPNRNITIKMSVPDNIWLIGSSNKFKVVITNLIRNAVESYEQTSSDHRPIFVRAKVVNDQLQIIIRDFGKGFFSSQNKHSGSHMGLGLSLAAYLLKQDFYGEVSFKRVIGRGSCCQILVGKAALIYNQR